MLDSASEEIIVENIPLDRRDVYRRNWWGTDTEREENELSEIEFMLDFQPEGAAERAGVENKLMSSIVAPNYLAESVIKYAGANPKDERVLEALHLAVQATRYAGSRDEKTGDYSRRAFEILHRRYPSSKWTGKTPYWYR